MNSYPTMTYSSPANYTIGISETDKRERLYDAFREYKREFYTTEMLLQILQSKAGGDINREAFTQIFNMIQKSPEGKFKIEDFIAHYLESEDLLAKKIETAKQQLNQALAIENQLETILQDQLDSMNTVNVTPSTEQIFWLNVLEAENDVRNDVTGKLERKFFASCFIQAECGKNAYTTPPNESLENPCWFAPLRITINSKEIKQIVVRIKDVLNFDYGFAVLKVVQFQNQKKKEGLAGFGVE